MRGNNLGCRYRSGKRRKYTKDNVILEYNSTRATGELNSPWEASLEHLRGTRLLAMYTVASRSRQYLFMCTTTRAHVCCSTP